jgi:uncharacterized membrane protein YjjP (DUF1212 family)
VVAQREVYESLDLALRLGEILLSSGAGAADVTATMLAVTSACGVTDVHADVTFVDLTLYHEPSLGGPATIRVRRVRPREVDLSDLTEADQAVDELVSGRITPAEALEQVMRIVATGHRRPRWTATLGWGVMGSGVALTLGGSAVVCLLAFASACAIDRTRRTLARFHMPSFYLQAAGGLVATLIAVAAAAAHVEVNPSRVVTVGIVMLLAGIGILGATQDAMTAYPVTANARLLDALLDTTGIIAGVGAGLTFGDVVGVGPHSLELAEPGLAAASVAVLGATLAAVGFAFASFAPLRSLTAAGLVGGMGEAVLLGVETTELGQPWGAGAAAVAIGASSYLVANKFRVPPLVVVVPAIVPLLPGLDIYGGLALLAEGKDGVLDLAAAFATALALAAGVILGQLLAQPLRREAHRWEARLAGPHMVGPLRRPRR